MTSLRIPDGFLKIQIPESYSSPTESVWEAGGVCLLDVLSPGVQGNSAPVLVLRELSGQFFFFFFFWRVVWKGNREIVRKSEREHCGDTDEKLLTQTLGSGNFSRRR